MEWKDITKFNGKFAVSNCGQIRNNKTGKVLKLNVNGEGYLHVTVKPSGRNGKAYGIRVHREVAKAFVPEVSEKTFVNHIDGVKTNNHYTNLEWVTNQENLDHAKKLGLTQKCAQIGSKNHKTKLTDEQVGFIINNYSPRHKKFGARALAKTLKVDHSVIVRIASGDERKHIGR